MVDMGGMWGMIGEWDIDGEANMDGGRGGRY